MALSATCLWESVNDLKPWLGLSAAVDVAHDAMLEMRANAVTEEVERETGRIYVSRSITETLSGTGTAMMALRAYPNVVISSFTRDGVAVSSSDYILDADAGLLTHKYTAWGRPTDLANVWGTSPGLYSITYTAGYARASLPASVLQVAVDLLRARYLTWGNSSDVFSYQAQAGGGTIQPVSDWISIRKQLDALRYEYRVGVA